MRHDGIAFWLAVAVLVVMCVPYGFAGDSEPRWLGIPVWFYVSAASALGITVLSLWRIWRRWETGP